ncbi:MAG TPA: hypothetical protein VGM10_33830 [Actinocrinis sp.]
MPSIHRYRREAALLVSASLAGAALVALPVSAAFAGTVTSGYDTASSTGQIGPAAPGDSLTADQMIDRAQAWIDDSVPYSQTAGWEDGAAGGPYREDCSGFVSMAWGLTTSMVTSTLPQVATVTDGNISGDTGLQTGDALDYTADHVVLFDSWIDRSSGTFYYDAEHTFGQVANRTEGNVFSSTLEGYSISVFEGLRYNHLAGQGSVSLNSGGSNAAFVNSSGDVTNDWGTTSGWAGPSTLGGSARVDSPVVEDQADDRVFFIEPDGAVADDWRTSTGWSGPSLIGGTARAGSGLSTDSSGDYVAFVDTSGAVVNDWRSTDGSWNGPSGMGGTARIDSPIVLDPNDNHVFFINGSNQVVNDWRDSTGAWAGPAATGGTARPGSGMSTDTNGDKVAFVNTSNQVANDYGTSSGWAGPALLGGTARAGSPVVFDTSANHVFFFNTSNAVVNDWVDSTGAWAGPAGVGGTARAGSDLTSDAAGDKVVFVDTSNAVVNDWGTSSGWAGPSGIGGTSR